MTPGSPIAVAAVTTSNPSGASRIETYVCTARPHGAYQYDWSDRSFTRLDESRLKIPVDICAASDGTLFVSEQSANSIYVYKPDGAYSQTIAATGFAPGALCYDKSGKYLFAVQRGAGGIDKGIVPIDMSNPAAPVIKQTLAITGPTGKPLNRLVGLCLYGGDLYAASSGGTVVQVASPASAQPHVSYLPLPYQKEITGIAMSSTAVIALSTVTDGVVVLTPPQQAGAYRQSGSSDYSIPASSVTFDANGKNLYACIAGQVVEYPPVPAERRDRTRTIVTYSLRKPG